MEEVLEVVLYIFFIVSALIMILLVLFRQGSGASGLGGAFGMGGDAAFGVKTAQLIDKIIIWVATIFILCAVFLTMLTNRKTAAADDGNGTALAPDSGSVAMAEAEPDDTADAIRGVTV